MAQALNPTEILIMGGVDQTDKNDVLVFNTESMTCLKVAQATFDFYSESNATG